MTTREKVDPAEIDRLMQLSPTPMVRLTISIEGGPTVGYSGKLAGALHFLHTIEATYRVDSVQ